MTKARPPADWETLQGIVQFLSDPRAKEEGIPRQEVARLLGVPADRVESWLDRINDALPGEPEPGSGVYAELSGELVRIYIGGLPGPTRFSLREALALLTLTAQLDLPGSPFAERTRKLEEKLLAAVAAGVGKSAGALHERIRIAPGAGTDNEHLSILEEATRERLLVELEYYNPNRERSWRREVRPHLLVSHMGTWYVVVDEEWVLRVDRIRSARLTGTRFDPPPKFDPEKYRRKVMFVGEPGKEIFLRSSRKGWSIKTAGPRQVRRWVIQRQGAVTIEAPEDERGKLLEETRQILKKYTD